MLITVRKMTEADVPAATAILAAWNMAPCPAEEHPERTEIVVEQAFVAVDGDRVVGVGAYLMLSETEAETANLAVDREYQGKGVGYLLQKARLDEMRRRGVRRVRTETDRPETVEWYIKKFGYRHVGYNPKKHTFSCPDVDTWTVLELAL